MVQSALYLERWMFTKCVYIYIYVLCLQYHFTQWITHVHSKLSINKSLTFNHFINCYHWPCTRECIASAEYIIIHIINCSLRSNSICVSHNAEKSIKDSKHSTMHCCISYWIETIDHSGQLCHSYNWKGLLLPHVFHRWPTDAQGDIKGKRHSNWSTSG